MKVVRVQYTVRPAYAGKNQENIAAIVEELKTSNHPGIKYGAHDFNAPYPLTEEYFKVFQAPYKKLILFDHSAHLPPFEEPAKFTTWMRRIAIDATAVIPNQK
jgi:pimeloyl-ACP methyl ester carboxylesterase